MLQRSVDDVSAYLLARDAIHPDELRACAAPLGIGNVDNLRDQTLTTVIAARGLDQQAEADLRAWAALYSSRNRATAVRMYLDSKGMSHDER